MSNDPCDVVEERITHAASLHCRRPRRKAQCEARPLAAVAILVAYRAIRMLVRGLLLSVLLLTRAAAADPDELPPQLPPPIKDERRAVLELMKRNTDKYGADVALLQGLLLTHSLQGDAVFTTESTILGFERSEGSQFVALRLASGMVVDDKRLGREQRLEHVWHVILERTLRKYQKFSGPGDGLAVEIEYSHLPYDHVSDLADLDEPGPLERGKFYMRSSDLADFLAYRIGAQDFLDRTRILLDDQPTQLQLTEVTNPPRPARAAAEQSSPLPP
jgi:hypothetical protein